LTLPSQFGKGGGGFPPSLILLLGCLFLLRLRRLSKRGKLRELRNLCSLLECAGSVVLAVRYFVKKKQKQKTNCIQIRKKRKMKRKRKRKKERNKTFILQEPHLLVPEIT